MIGMRIVPHCIMSAIAAAIMISVASACSSDECLENKNALPLAGFYSSEENPKNISLSYLTVFGLNAPGDSLLVDSAASTNEIYIPFRIDEPKSAYVFAYAIGTEPTPELNDTVTFYYDQTAQFVSMACGASYIYDVYKIEHTTHFIDSVVCPKGLITNSPGENLKIFFRVSNEL